MDFRKKNTKKPPLITSLDHLIEYSINFIYLGVIFSRAGRFKDQW